jgi:hypothetical protein
MVVSSRKRHQMRHLDVLYHFLRDQEVDGSNPFAPTNYFTISNLQAYELWLIAWRWNAGTRRSMVQIHSPDHSQNPPFH